MLSAVGYSYLKQVRNGAYHLKETNSFDTYRAIFSVEVDDLCSSKTSAIMLLCVLSLHKSFLIECSFLKVFCLFLQAPWFVGPMPKSVLYLMLCSLGLTSSL